METVAEFDHVSKRYYLGKRRAFIHEIMPRFLKRNNQEHGRTDEIWALRDFSFSVQPGEAVGIIGSNGSGKTTTLSLMAGISSPTTGVVRTSGTIGALIQLGAGFHPELTGRENVYLNATIFGLSKAQIDRIYDKVVDFAEIHEFMDTPVKRYSSGMYARLGFSVAAHINPDILLVDEVLAVGDMAFQSKCISRMHELVSRGCAVVFVSHNLNLVQSLCSRALRLDAGRCVQDGPAMNVIAAYSEEMERRILASSHEDLRTSDMGTGAIKLTRVILRDQKGIEASDFLPNDSLTVELHYDCAIRIENPYFWVTVVGKQAGLFTANMLLDGKRPPFIEGQGVISCTFHSLPLMPQNYSVAAGIRGGDGASLLIQSRHVAMFRVKGNSSQLGLSSPVAESIARDAPPVIVPYEWRLPGGQNKNESR